jgi:hypothetical protein
MGMICRTLERDGYSYKILVVKPEGKDQLGNSAVGYRCCSLVDCVLHCQLLNYRPVACNGRNIDE